MHVLKILTASLVLGFTACSGSSQAKAPVSNSTLSAALQSTVDIHVKTLAGGLKAPWNLTFLPNGDMLVTEKLGGLVRVDAAGRVTPISGAPKAYSQGQAGLFDVMLSEQFETDSTVFLSYADGGDKNNAVAVFKARLKSDALVDGVTIFKAGPKDTSAHYGGRMALLADNSLLLTTGDGFTYREKAQKRSSHLGKILRLTTDGKAAGGNPFAGEPDAQKEIYSYGHRNVQGLDVDEQTGVIWSHEHGPKGGDELNLIKAGDNYGWPVASFGVDYSGASITPFTAYAGMTDSVHHWVPSIAPSGMTVYRGGLFDGMDGDIFVGGLASRDLRRLHMENDRVVKETIWLSDLGARIRDVQTGPDGALYVLTDDKTDGKVLRLTPTALKATP